MKILALETSGLAADVALLDANSGEPQAVARRALPAKPRISQTLAPTMRDLLGEASWKPRDVDLVAVATGPGSFTGLRLGVTTAKVFAYAAAAKVQGVNTLEAIALNAAESVRSDTDIQQVCVVIDAQRSEVFSAAFSADELRRNNQLVCVAETSIVDNDTWWRSLTAGDLILGPGLQKFREQIEAGLPADVTLAAEELWQPSATAIGEIAWRSAQSGETDIDVWSLMPRYYRQSAAEEKRAAATD